MLLLSTLLATGTQMQVKNRATYHHGDLRQALLDNACDILETEGAEGLSLRSVAARSGVSHNAPYRHFRDRSALLSAVAERGFQDLTEKMASAAGAEDPLARIAEAYLTFARARPQMYRLMFASEAVRAAPGPDPQLRATSKRTFDAVRTAVNESLSKQSGNADGVAAMVWAPLHGLALLLIENRILPWMRDDVTDEQFTIALGASLASFAREADFKLRLH
ncbi:MAG TPA: TetR/AcrR family transcriptional regulator [Allosphingosinicella sp.]|nr:TetR/AcrR family transcriptional regulator [Allosphingosinicella sp.]